MAACAHVRRVGSEANVDKSREQAFRPPHGGELGERYDKCHDKRHDKRHDIGGYCRRTYPELLWRPEDVLCVQLGRTLCRRTPGYEWGNIDNNPARPSGIAGGLEAGFNWQSGNFVYGGEADINLSTANDTFAPWQFSNPWFGTVRGRAGIAINNALLFGTAGLAYGELTGTTSGNVSESHASLGWVADLGTEVNLAQHWSVKAE